MNRTRTGTIRPAHTAPRLPAVRRAGRPWAWTAVAPAFAALGVACGATRLGATDLQLASGRERATPGAGLFSAECARCHGEHGEGLAGSPAILGPGALPEFPRDLGNGNASVTDPQQLQIQQQSRPEGAPSRDPFRNAQNLFDFVKTHLPKSRAAAVKPADYWAVVTFVVAVQGADLPAGGVTADNAASVLIPH
jgi:hypothetical protein